MSDQDETFRVNVRFNRVEYSDLDEDLRRFEGANKGARIRMLMRLGLQVAKGQIPSLPHAGEHPHLAAVVGIPRSHKKADATPTPPPVESVASVPTSSTRPAPSATIGTGESQPKAPAIEALDALSEMGFDTTHFQFGAAAR